MAKYIIQRLILTLPVLIGVSLLVFILVRMVPGDIVDILLGPEMYVPPEVRARMRAQFGLDEPVHVQYVKWMGEVVKGNLGYSLRTRRPVFQTIVSNLPVTIELTILSMIVSAMVAIPLGILSAVRSNSTVDFLARLAAMLGLSLPNFWLASMLLLISSLVFKWFPSTEIVGFFQDPLRNLSQMLMPVTAVSAILMAVVMRMTRSAMLEVLRQDYIQTARAKGLTDRLVLLRHALKNALIPVITIMGIQMGQLLGGVVIIEQVFGLPGIGWLLLNAIYQRDYPLIQGTVLFIAVMFVLVNLLVDVMYAYLDPRIRYA